MRSLKSLWRELWPNDQVLGINRRNLDHVFAEYRPGKFHELDDKLLAKSRCEDAGVAVPRTIGILRTQLELDELRTWLAQNDELVLKPARGWGGRGILVLRRDGDAFLTPGGTRLSVEEIEDHARETLAGNFSLDESDDAVLVEERVHPHRFIQDLYPRGLSDLRVVLQNGRPLQAMLRVPTDRSDGKANLHGGGIGLGIELDTGRVHHAIQGDRPIDTHPDTGLELVGTQVPLWEACVELARRTAAIYSNVEYIGVDIVLDSERGPLVLEVNARPGLAIQIANRAAQPVSTATRSGPFERWTFVSAWLVFAAIAVAPLIFASWQSTSQESGDEVEVTTVSQRGGGSPEIHRDDTSTVEWSEAASEISSENAEFARARELAAEGDQAGAIAAYTEAAADSAIAPFAWNNIGLLHREAGDLDQAEAALSRAVQSHPDYARGHYNLGLVHRDQGNTLGAETDFRMAIAERPSYGRAWGELGGLLATRGATTEAVEALGLAIRYEPTLSKYRKTLGRVHAREGRWVDAAQAYRRALALDPDSKMAAEGWVRSMFERAMGSEIELSQGVLDSMEALTERFDAQNQPVSSRMLAAEVRWLARGPAAARSIARDLGSSANSRARRLSWVTDLALGIWTERDASALVSHRAVIELARLGRELEAASSAQELLAEFDAYELTDPRLALLLLRLQGVSASARARERALDRCSSSAQRHWVLQMADSDRPLASPDSLVQAPMPKLLHRQPVDSALPLPQSFLLWSTARVAEFEGSDDTPWFEGLLETGKNFRPAMQRNFQAAVGREDPRLAREIGLQLLDDAADPTEILLPLMRLELGRRRPVAARSLWKRLDLASRRAPDAQILYAEILLAEKKPKNATKKLDQVLAQAPTHVEALRLRGKALAARRKYDEARASFARALDQEPNRGDIRADLAKALMAERDYPAAVEEWQRVLSLAPAGQVQRSGLFNLALSEQRAERFEAAIEDWGRFLQAAGGPENPENYRAYYNLALAQESLGRTEAAASSLEQVLQLEPDHAASRDRLARLRTKGSEQ